MICVSAATPGIAIAEVFGRRGAAAPITTRFRHRVQRRRFEAIAQRGDPVDSRQFRRRRRGSGGETGDAGQVLGAGAAAALLAAAAQQRRRLDAAGHDESADARRAADLVRRQG